MTIKLILIIVLAIAIAIFGYLVGLIVYKINEHIEHKRYLKVLAEKERIRKERKFREDWKHIMELGARGWDFE